MEKTVRSVEEKNNKPKLYITAAEIKNSIKPSDERKQLIDKYTKMGLKCL